ncbi:trimethoprim-resistant dihydrofolate reductase DfrA18 [Klebsiella pneumoniae]|uniref:trimethoprim-resistant dihydrofolate reductase DfrA18 n=1 Tax=Klebsiella pneumoniae TaxID=573 RepID=UPI000B41CB95|nr:trimethoprim-resistant dihydrofolate reductase DfrA18 [Klebsiella pneumoniae]BDV50666.1 dihydrofolate reductase [uncultured bacterium]EIW9109945.1 trimethoprim-resistant dihydrofolate reductase DfrA18 [Klebsiella pneumoniae]EIW9110152.1 trimethoprim-resistant dihydrofolate reductase DfrA18 [Klebsiella pneumoniae]MBD7100032.1 trimethoprim-resistant dihydrofolate reductase DfrA18 [Klebsiella pneumoniae]MBZ1898656.1 trimethoprim-resistant dihydrofolate reductase DfrA18 [Klebsiella pneumoniae]
MNKEIQFSMIVARGVNGEIGQDGDLPWHVEGVRLKEDLKRFKAITMGKTLVMGRKTFESIPNGLPGRNVIVLTLEPYDKADITERGDGTFVAWGNSCHLFEVAEHLGVTEIIVAGGAEIYNLHKDVITKVFETKVLRAYPAADTHVDVFWESPGYDTEGRQWRVTSRGHIIENGSFTIATTYER